MGILRRPAAVAGALLLAAAACAAAQAAPEYQAKVVLMDKLTRFVDWPQGGDPRRAFVLAVVGRTPFGDELESYFAARTLKDRPVVVRYPHQLSELGECDLVFICASERGRLGAILERVRQGGGATPIEYSGGKIEVTISLGGTTTLGDEAEDEILFRADEALYRAKDLGRNRVEMTAE